MTDATAAFFDDLRQRDHEPLLEHKQGTVRVEVVDNGRTKRWLIAYDDGKIQVSSRKGAADATIRADKALFDRLASGDANAVSAVLRGDVSLEGDWNAAILFQRLFPSPPGSRGGRPAATTDGRRS
jgi:putative sterol carrier protein